MSISRQIEIKSSKENIFLCLVKPQELNVWWMCDAIVDAKVGGLWVLGWGKDSSVGHQTVMAGVISEYHPYDRLKIYIDPVYIEFELASIPGGTMVSLTQDNYPDPESEENAFETWYSSLQAMKSHCETRHAAASSNKPTVNVMMSDISYPGRDNREPSGMYNLKSGEIAHPVDNVPVSEKSDNPGDFKVLDDGGFPITNPWGVVKSWKKEQGFGYVDHPEIGEVMFDYDGCDFEPVEGDKVLLLVIKKTWNGKPKCKRISCPAKGSSTKA
ncbi:SRPBCC domain-containing protein [Myxococcota bacterium]|nr:SRPBCC domain-containing protein [Myxococcota bacterium]MBU1382003.1 SRPBCC domain-containing protein [Myxococcota bacterium]MBU1497660.1 SRPBCC domain-containing protein [Myxococcota bacterium]